MEIPDKLKFEYLLSLDNHIETKGIDNRKETMKKILNDIQTGKFTREWMLENKVNQTSFKAIRNKNANHPIEEVGEKLRSMMPWIGSNKLVDKGKN